MTPRTAKGLEEIDAPRSVLIAMMSVDLVALARSYEGNPFRGTVYRGGGLLRLNQTCGEIVEDR